MNQFHSSSHSSKSKIFSSILLILVVAISSCTSNPKTNAQPQTSPTPFSITVPTTPPSCTALTSEPTPGPDAPSLFPAVSNEDHVRGSDNAVVTIMVYADYQDAPSGSVAKEINQLLTEYPNDLRFVSRLYPLTTANDKAALAAQAAEAANEQNKFWEVYDLLYTQQDSWIKLSATDFEHWLAAQITGLGLDANQFQSDLKSDKIVAKVQKALDDSQKMGIPGVPLIIINGQIYMGPRDYNSLRDIVQLIALGKKQFTKCPTVMIETNKKYTATLYTEKGNIVIELFADKTPITVNSFVFLAKNGWYNDNTFHRVIPNLFAQTGDPSGTGKGNPGYYLISEILPSLAFNKPGMVAMVNSGPDTTGGQFFITYAAAEQFNGKYTIFGQVISGMDVLKSLTPRDAQPGSDTPPGDKLLKVEISEQ